MKVLVTGARGQLGRDVVDLFSKNHDVYGYGRKELDITSAEQVRHTIQEVHPDVVVHAAAYTAVDKAEEDESQAFLVNAIGSQNVAVAAADVGAKLCAISTDYVFDGEACEPYAEEAQVNPRSVYGKTKLAGERFIREVTDRYFIVRTSWVFGLHGSNFVKTMLKLGGQGKQLQVVNDQIGGPTYTKDLSRFLLELIESNHFGIYHASNTGACSWFEFATEIFQQAGLVVNLQPCTTEEFPRPAPRPKYSVLAHRAIQENGFHLLRTWENAVRDFMREWNKCDTLEV